MVGHMILTHGAEVQFLHGCLACVAQMAEQQTFNLDVVGSNPITRMLYIKRKEVIKMEYPLIDISATGRNIARLREENGITVRALSRYLGMANTNSIYRWFRGETLPSLDNLYAISVLLNVSMNDIIVETA